MSTNLIIGIIAAVAVVGGGTYVVMNPEIITSITGGVSMEGEEMMENGEISSAGSTFANLIALGRSVVCTFSHDDGAGNASSGTMYMTSGAAQIRGDFTVTQSTGGPMEAHMVRTGGYTYLWGPAMPQGIKSKVVNETDLTSNDQGGIDPDTEFSCQAWAIDNSKFTVPTTVQFMEVNVNAGASGSVNTGGTDVSGSASGSAGANAAQCASCNQLPAGAKEQCLATLSC